MKTLLKCLLILLIALACKKHGDDPANTASAKITLNTFADNANTIALKFHSVLNVTLVGSQYPKYILKIYDQNHPLLTDSSYDGVFHVPTDNLYYESGLYSTHFGVYGGSSAQTFKQIISSGTMVCQRSVVIDYSGFSQLPEPIMTATNGTLQGTFNTLLSIQALTVRKFYNGANVEVTVDSVVGTGNGVFVFTDHSYVGERTWYTLAGYSMTDSGILAYSSSGGAHREIELQPHTVTSDANGNPVIKWRRNQYYQNFGSYRIRKQRSEGSNASLIREITDINDTLQTAIDLGFPAAINVFVAHLPKENLQYIPTGREIQDYGYGVTYHPGLPFRPHDDYASPRGNDVYVHKEGENWLCRYSAQTFQKVDSIYCPDWRFAVSPNNRYVLTLKDDRFHLYDVSTRQDISVAITNFLPVANVYDFDVSDAGTICVMNEFSNLKLIDVINNQLLGTLQMTNGTLNVCQISSTGTYVHVYTEYKNRVYRFSGGTFSEVYYNVGAGFISLKFIADQPDKALIVRSAGYDICNLVTGIPEFSAPWGNASGEISIDFNDYLMLLEGESNTHVIDIRTGQVVKVLVHNMDYANPHKTWLHGHTLFNGLGARMTFLE